jgi:hypothetical protein
MGYLRIRDLSSISKGACVLQIEHNFRDEVRILYHFKVKNLMFAASEDGRMCFWKLPPEWGPTWIDEKLRELRMVKGAGNF